VDGREILWTAGEGLDEPPDLPPCLRKPALEREYPTRSSFHDGARTGPPRGRAGWGPKECPASLSRPDLLLARKGAIKR
jgi:hypothetical protein